MPVTTKPDNTAGLAEAIKARGLELGFDQIGISNIDLEDAGQRLEQWLADGLHGDMRYMARHGAMRYRPDELEPGTISVICARMDYRPQTHAAMQAVLDTPASGYIARYALGRDYHKLMRRRLARLARMAGELAGAGRFRALVDSAPVMEKPLAAKAGLGWMGKHTNIINKDAGSWFLLGEIYTDLQLPADQPVADHCGDCSACIDICPTRAIVAPWKLDARLCISYLTIENRGPIPAGLRPLIGNRIYGCDDCQLVCPWNRFSKLTREDAFLARSGLEQPPLAQLLQWDEREFQRRTEGSAIRRTGHQGWLRNVAVALGNGIDSDEAVRALERRSRHDSELVREHALWALKRLRPKA